MVAELEISHLNYVELNALRDRIDALMQKMRQESGPQLVERFENEAAARGLTIDDLVRAAKKRKRGNSRGRHQEPEAGAT